MQQVAIDANNIESLSGRRWFGSAGVMPLFRNVAKEFALRILLVINNIDIDRDRNKRLVQQSSDTIISESGRTARNTVVSDTA